METGCHSRDFWEDEEEAGHRPLPVFASFSCDEDPANNGTDVKCVQCFADGFAALKQGCQGRAGGTVLLGDCCVRYEIYDICM
ncbi:unnamed protein product [Linum trigynum]|uniref:Gnk2-homologous domain-containing protein n=1 Tax=Linum trigynum TaxID=586398 RepID=A0AAV2GFU0_9ROSI